MNDDLQEFFSTIGKARKEKEDEFNSLVGDLGIDSIFDEVKESVKKDKKDKKKLEKQAKELEEWLYSEPEDSIKIDDLNGNPAFEIIDIIKPEPFEGTSPKEVETPPNIGPDTTEYTERIEEEESTEQVTEQVDTVDHALQILEKIKTKQEVRENTDDPEIVKIRGELEYLKNLVNAQGGGGEVRLEFLDDIDRDSAKVDGKFLKYQSSTGKWVGATASGGSGSQTLDETLGLGNTSSLGMSVGVVTATTFDGNLATTNLTGTITNAQLAGSITNAKLSNSTVSYGGISLALGASDSTPAFDLQDATGYRYSVLTGVTTDVVGDSSPQLGGNLDLNSKSITGTGNINMTGVVTATTFDGNLATTNLTGTITNAQLAGSIANAKLVNDSVSFGGISVDLGASDSTPAFDLQDATGYRYSVLTGVSTDIVGDPTPQLGGNLDLNSKTITGTGDISMTGVVTATSFSGNLATTDLTGTITNTQLAGSIANAKLVNDSVSFGGISVDLGSSDATPAFDLQHATNYPYTSLTGITTNIVGDTSPQLGGNLDLNSNNITGTGNINITGDGTFSGNISVGGTLTYEDVTNIDSVGIVTARKGIIVGSGYGIHIASGVVTATTFDGALATSSLTGTITNAQLAGSIANGKLSNDSVTYTAGNALTGGGEVELGASATLNVAVDDSSIEVSSDALRVKATGITNAMLAGSIANDKLAGSIANSKLANNSVSYGGIELALGASDSTPAFDLQDATGYRYSVLTGVTTHLSGDTSPQLGGNLDLNSKTITGTGDINMTGVVTATSFSGNITGNVTGNVSGSSGSATGNAGGLTGTPNISCGTIAGSTGTFTGDVDIADKIIHTGDTDTAIRFPEANTISADTGGIERLRIDSSGNVLIGDTKGEIGKLSTLGTGNHISAIRHSSDISSSNFLFVKYRGSRTTPAIILDGDMIGDLAWYGYNGTNIIKAASISASANGTVDGSNMTTDLVFATTSGNTNTERLRITSAGRMGIGEASPSTKLHVAGDVKVVNTGITYLQSNSSTAFETYESSGSVKAYITNAGAATFVGKVDIGSSSLSSVGFTIANNATWNTLSLQNHHASGKLVAGFNGSNAETVTITNAGAATFINTANAANSATYINGASTDALQVVTAGANKVLVKMDGSATFAGKITLSNSSGIQFGSSDTGTNITSQTLDDYEEGSWTPQLFKSGTQVTTLDTAQGYYTKIGRQVWLSFYIYDAYATTTGTGLWEIKNLPFTLVAGGISGYNSIPAGYQDVSGTHGSEMNHRWQSNTSGILECYGPNATTNCTNNYVQWSGSGVFFV